MVTDAGRLSDIIESILLDGAAEQLCHNTQKEREAMLTQELIWEFRKFRLLVESEAGELCESFEVNTALLLSDLMRHLGFGDIEHDDVLGESAARFVSEFVEGRVCLPAASVMIDAEVAAK